MFILLLSVALGLASSVLAQDCSKPPAGPNMSLKDSDIVLASFPDGSKATFQCNFGYSTLSGSRFVTCTAGSWSALTLTCERKNCGSAGELSNGNIEYPEGTQFGDKAVPRCNVGYNLVGSHELKCGDGQWMQHLPSCEAVVCYPPRGFKNGTYSPFKEEYQYRDTIQYSCVKGHAVDGSRTSTCSEDKYFKPAPPLCPPVQCPDPEVSRLKWLSGSLAPHGHLAGVKLGCESGFLLVGSPNQICDINSKWSPGLPTCQQKSTTVTPAEKPVKPVTPGKPVTPVKPVKPVTPVMPATPVTPVTPGGAENNVGKAFGIALAVLTVIGVVTVCGCYYGGVPARIRRRRNAGSRKISADAEAVKEGETVALS